MKTVNTIVALLAFLFIIPSMGMTQEKVKREEWQHIEKIKIDSKENFNWGERKEGFIVPRAGAAFYTNGNVLIIIPKGIKFDGVDGELIKLPKEFLSSGHTTKVKKSKMTAFIATMPEGEIAFQRQAWSLMECWPAN